MTRPRVNDKRPDRVAGERQRFSSAILPARARKTPKITEVLPLLSRHGPSSQGLRARARPVPRVGGRAAGGGDHPADRAAEGGAARLRRAGHAGADYACPRADGINPPHNVALVSAEATSIDGKLVERPGEEAQPEAA